MPAYQSPVGLEKQLSEPSVKQHYYHQTNVIGGGLMMGQRSQPVVDKEAMQRQRAEELQEQIRQRDEQKFKEAVRARAKQPSFAFDPDEPLPNEKKNSKARQTMYTNPSTEVPSSAPLVNPHETMYSQMVPVPQQQQF